MRINSKTSVIEDENGEPVQLTKIQQEVMDRHSSAAIEEPKADEDKVQFESGRHLRRYNRALARWTAKHNPGEPEVQPFLSARDMFTLGQERLQESRPIIGRLRDGSPAYGEATFRNVVLDGVLQ